MASIDDLFKGRPSGSNKRRSEAIQDPTEVYKQAKVNGSSDVRQANAATVEDEDDDEYAGPELPPDFDEGEDEEGRFFGGGVDQTTAQAMQFVDELEKDGDSKVEKIDAAWVRKLALNFEKKISKNAEQRTKYDGDPAKFMGSEADLDDEIKSLSVLSEYPELYAEFVHLGCEQSLVSLLSHENTDIAIDAIQIVNELIDEETSSTPEQRQTLLDALLEADLIDLLYQNLGRLDEASDADRDGIYHILTSFESLSNPGPVSAKLGAHASILTWLTTRATAKESPVTQNKQYAAEVLSILLLNSSNLAAFVRSGDGIDALLQALSAYRRKDPLKDTEEEEFFENAFDALTRAVASAPGKAAFVAAEGVELCVLMLREGHASKPRALRLLDHALARAEASEASAAPSTSKSKSKSKSKSDNAGDAPSPDTDAAMRCAEALVEAPGLKPLFAAFAKAAQPPKAGAAEPAAADAALAQHALGVLSALLRLLPGDSAPRIRLLAKFVERDYAHAARLVALRRRFATSLAAADADIAEERAELEVDDGLEYAFTLRRLEAGGYAVQLIDTVLAWLVAEDDGARGKIAELLGERDESIDDLRKGLQAQLDGVEEEDAEVRDMLAALVLALGG